MTFEDSSGSENFWWRSLSLEQCQHQLQRSDLPASDRLQLCHHLSDLLVQRGSFSEAIALLQQSLSQNPNPAETHHHLAKLYEQIGNLKQAIAHYKQAISLSTTPTANRWIEQGHAYRGLGQYREALNCYEQGLAIAPDDLQALTGKGGVLAVLGQKRAAMRICQKALEQYPTAAEAWHGMGVVLSVSGRNKEALIHFEKALTLNPNFDRARCNRGIVLTRMERYGGAIANFDAALYRAHRQQEAWHGSAFAYRGYALMRVGRFEEAIDSCDRALKIQPRSYPAAFARTVSLVMTGQFWRHLSQRNTRRSLLKNLGIILNLLKFRFLILFGTIALLIYGQGGWAEALRAALPWVLSVGIIALVGGDLWKHRDRLGFVWKTYWTSPLTYLRAFAIVIVTLTTYAIADSIVPPFMRWGWANWVFGQPGNIIFQPFHLIEESTSAAPNLLPPESVTLVSPPSELLVASPAAETVVQFSPNYATILIVLLWILLIFGIPFWARLEERIFRKGANTWGQIAIRSTQFGLVHLLVGIPIVGGFVLILPGFLFAWRYKFVRDRHLKRTGNSFAAQEAGLDASTTDHAVYNAILITLAVALLLTV